MVSLDIGARGGPWVPSCGAFSCPCDIFCTAGCPATCSEPVQMLRALTSTSCCSGGSVDVSHGSSSGASIPLSSPAGGPAVLGCLVLACCPGSPTGPSILVGSCAVLGT
jgi:hypothetical protein